MLKEFVARNVQRAEMVRTMLELLEGQSTSFFFCESPPNHFVVVTHTDGRRNTRRIILTPDELGKRLFRRVSLAIKNAQLNAIKAMVRSDKTEAADAGSHLN